MRAMERKPVDLTKVQIPVDGGYGCPLEDHSTSCLGVKAEVFFRDQEAALIERIAQADVVVGCVAWLTSYPILDALADIHGGVSVIVQKEDFLRPDSSDSRSFNRKLRQAYDRLHPIPDGRMAIAQLARMSWGSDFTIDPVRCVGNRNRDRRPAFPRMHNKFLVFCSGRKIEDEHGWEFIKPYAVWTGSLNLSKNATASFENALYLTNCPQITDAYFEEWAQIAALSEPLDWESDWCAPEWRIGS